MNTNICILFALASGTATALHAGPRTSANYNVPTDTTDSGGNRTTSASYMNDGSAGGVVGVSTVAMPDETAKHGYVGQLYDVTSLLVNAGVSSVNETAPLQLGAWQRLDDASFLSVPAGSVVWGIVSGPVTGISLAGLATMGTVYQATPATVQGTFGGFTGTLNLTVLDTIPDNFGSYAGDGIADDWQVQYFGLNNPNAAPGVDFDGTGQTNLFKYIAGLDPLDPNSRFTLSIASVPGQPEQTNLIFSPVVADRTYTVKAKGDLLGATWDPVTVSPPTDNGPQRTLTDTDATGARKFYRIEITKP